MKQDQKRHLAWIWNIWRERKWLILLLFVLTLISSAVAVAYPYISKLLIDSLQKLLERGGSLGEADHEIQRLAMLVLSVGAAGFIASLFPGIRGAANSVFEYLLRRKYFAAVMGKDYRFFSTFRTGDVTTRLTDDISDYPKLSWFLCSGIFRAVESLGKVLFCLVAMLLLDWRLTLLSLIPVPLMIVVYAIAQDRIYDTYSRNQEAISDINNQLEMSFAGVRIIKSYNSERKYERFFSEALKRRFGTELAVTRLETIIQLIYQYIDYFAQIGIIFAGGYMAVKGDITIGTFYAVYNYLGMLIYPILDIPNLFVVGKRAFVNMDRLDEMKNFGCGPEAGGSGATAAGNGAGAAAAKSAKSEKTAENAVKAAAGTDTHGGAGAARGASKAAESQWIKSAPRTIAHIDSVAVEDLAVRYQGRDEEALSSLSFALSRGERLAVIGAVGSGKSSLVKALAGLILPSRGRVLIDGLSLDSIDRPSFCDLLGYVPQDPLLFSGTIRENVAFGTKGSGFSIGDDELRRSLESAQIADEVALFGQGAETKLGPRGAAVSGGQKQRIAIARALARHPEFLLLDDITASLDAANEEKLWEALSAQAADTICIVVSHRLSTLNYTDKVLFLDGGKSIAFGRHRDLSATNSAYRDFISEHFAEQAGH